MMSKDRLWGKRKRLEPQVAAQFRLKFYSKVFGRPFHDFPRFVCGKLGDPAWGNCMPDIERSSQTLADFSADTVEEDAVHRDACVPCEDLRYFEDRVLRCIITLSFVYGNTV